MALLDDLHHLAFITGDMDRLIAFYHRVFDARVTFDARATVAVPVRRAGGSVGRAAWPI